MSFTDKGNGHHVTVRFDEHFTNAVLWQQGAEKVRLHGALERLSRQHARQTRGAGGKQEPGRFF